MKCPQCGSEMVLDSHRKIPLMMCYDCGYIEGRKIEAKGKGETNYEHLKKLNFNEMVAFLSGKLNMPEERFAAWLNEEV
jgi:Zn ribbon nucleic-acid-binding protein